MTDQPTPETNETLSALDAQQKIVREHTLSLHVMGEQLTQIESWFWAHLADIRDAARQQLGGPLLDDVTAIPARTTPDNPATSSDTADNCCVCGGGHVVYRNYREQPFCWPCADCNCNQDVCVRTGINDPAVSGDSALRQQIAAAIEADAERPRDQRVGIINAVMTVRDRDRRALADEVTRLSAITGQLRALATRWQATVRPGERHPAAAAILNVLDGDGPSVAECAKADRVWPLQKGGE